MLGNSTIYHVDLYRLDSVSEQDKAALGLADAFTRGEYLCHYDMPSKLAFRGG